MGCTHWGIIMDALRAGGVDLASGTTDVEAFNAEWITLFRGHCIKSVGRELFGILSDVLFLRVLRRRSHAGSRPSFAAGKNTIAQ